MDKVKRVPKATWVNIKNEYLTDNISLRALAKKYELAFSTVTARAREEGWENERRQLSEEVAEAVAKTKLGKLQTNTEKAEIAVGTILDKVIIASAMIPPSDTKGLKDITAMMKDLKELQVFTLKDADEDAVRVSLLPEIDEFTE